ncbi:long-chain fatty acid--CoA ligase [Streptomyces sp. NPDC004286]|uniref:long-chain-fatty-acid--CoA ligase n=1 Tax=Streptomyces sp. NPDC004286 TaxID=3364696 RepID=UPI0036CB712A
MSFNIEAVLREAAANRPDRPMLHFGDQSFSYAEVEEASSRVAACLMALGLKPGERVAVRLPNIPQFVFAYFGIMKAGLVMVPLNPLLRAAEIAHHLRDSGSAVLITSDEFTEEALKGLDQFDNDVTTFVVRRSATSLPVGTRDFDDLLTAEPLETAVATSADDTAVIIYTSGTTGLPKGAELTHLGLYMNCTLAAETFELRGDDVGMAVLPLFHVFGLSSVLNTTIRYGGTLVLVPRFEITAVIDAIERHRVTLFAGVPTMYVALLNADTTGRDMSCLRMGSSGGSAMPDQVRQGIEDKFPGMEVLEGYGMSETASAAAFNRNDSRRAMSVGKPMWGVQMRVVDGDDLPLPRGQEHVGEILVRGHNVMKGYFGNPEATADAIRDGWLHTGDLGYVDEDGYFFIVGRKKDLVIRGGYNVYPREVEEVLFAHPAVLEAAVVGRPDVVLGEEVVAFVVVRPDTSADGAEIIAYCRERLAAYKYPREVRLVEALPKGPSGKILKRDLVLSLT